MKKNPRSPAALTRRRFVGLMTAGAAALIAPGAAHAVTASSAPARRRAAAGATAALSPVDRKELLRQQAATQETLKVIRSHAMAPGTEMAAIFKPLRPRRDRG